jgi:hypothetical protein
MSENTSAVDHYERGLLLKKVQIFDSALQEFQQATKSICAGSAVSKKSEASR